MESEKTELKSILRGLLISSPRQMTVRELANDFSRQEGREFPFRKFGFRTFVDYLNTIRDTVVLSGSQPIYVSPVVKKSTAHVNEMVLNQRNSSSRKSSYRGTEKSQRKRGWMPIVIPPDPAKTLPTLLDIKIPSRNKFMSDVSTEWRTVTRKSSSQKSKLENIDGADTKNYEKHTEYQENNYPRTEPWKKGLENTECQENTYPHTEPWKKGLENTECQENTYPRTEPLKKGLENKMDSVASEPSEKWEDFCERVCDENKGHDDSLFQKYCAQNIHFRSINRIDEWFPKEIRGTSPQNDTHSAFVSDEFKDAGNNLEQPENKNVSKSITKSPAKNLSETKADTVMLSEQRDVTAYEHKTNTPSSPAPSGGSSCSASSLQNRLFSEKTVSNMQKLIRENPQGLWASEFPAIYKEYFGVPLDYHAYGYVSMAAVAGAYSDIFICIRRSSADFLLFDSGAPLPKHYANSANMNSYGVVTEVIKSNVERLIAEFPTGLPVGKFKEMYKLYFSEDINEGELGFPSINELLQSLHEEFILRLRQVGKNTLLYPARNLDSVQQEPPLCSKEMEYDSVEPFTAYPPEVLDPHDNIQRQPLPRLRGDFPVLVSDVSTPARFSMILYDLRYELESLMDEIQFFYATEGEKYKMPHRAICKGLLCIARYESNQEWHRAKICTIQGGMDKIQVNYIDYGTVGFVKSEDLRYMHRDFAQLPMQGIPARLTNLEPAEGKEWKKEVGKYFLDLVCGKVLMAVIDRTNQDNLVSVGLVDTSGEDDVHINDELVLNGYAKFKHEPPQNSSDVSIGKSEVEFQNNNFESNKWKLGETVYCEQKFPNDAENCRVPSTSTAPGINKETEHLYFSGVTKDDLPQNSPTVSTEQEVHYDYGYENWKSDGKTTHDQIFTNGDDSSNVSSTIKIPKYDEWNDVKKTNIELEEKCLSGTVTSTDGSAWCKNTVHTSSNDTKKSEIGHFPSKEDIMTVWGAQLMAPSPINSTVSDSNEADTHLNLKKIPNTWQDIECSKAPNSGHLTGNTDNTKLGSKIQNALTGDPTVLSSSNNVSPLSGKAKTNNSQNVRPHSVTAPSHNFTNMPFVQHDLYTSNMWNLGNINVKSPWIPSGNNPVANSVSSLVPAGQTSWFQPGQNTSQFPLTPFVAVSPVPPPGFAAIQNPFLAFTTSRLPAVDPQMTILNGSLVYQHQNNPWASTFSGVQSAPKPMPFSNSAGPFLTGHNNSGKFVNSSPDICEITQSTENLSVEDCKKGSKDARQRLKSSKETTENYQVKSSGITQCTQTAFDDKVLKDTHTFNAWSSERPISETVTEAINGSGLGGKKGTYNDSDYNRKSENGCKSLDVCMSSGNSAEAVQNIENCTTTEKAPPNNSNGDSVSNRDTYVNSPSTSCTQETDSWGKVEAVCEAKEPDSVIKDSEPTIKTDSENVLSRRLKTPEIDSSLKSTTPSGWTLSWTAHSSVKNDKQNDWHSYSTETCARDEEEITRYIPSQEAGITTEQKRRQPIRYIKKTLISGRVLNLINYKEEGFFCTDEVVRSFSKFSGRHVLLKILDTTGITVPFIEVNRSDNFEMFQMLDNCDLNTKSRKPNGQIHDVLHLVPLRSTTDILKALKISEVSIISGIMEEIENFNPEDDYWYRD